MLGSMAQNVFMNKTGYEYVKANKNLVKVLGRFGSSSTQLSIGVHHVAQLGQS
jgi:hypothetical protein